MRIRLFGTFDQVTISDLRALDEARRRGAPVKCVVDGDRKIVIGLAE